MCHALVIEDDFLAADYIAAMAKIAGATSTAIATTEDAAVRAAEKTRPEIILCDVRLADGCGRSAASRIHDKHGPIPTLFVTGEPGVVAGEPGASANSTDLAGVLAKPFEREAFIKAFQAYAPWMDPAAIVAG